MKRILILSFLSLIINSGFSQSPEGFTYQSILRDLNGEVVPLQSVDIRFSILQGSASGPSIYTETHSAITNDFGLINLFIGSGVTSDDLSLINWTNGPYFAFVEADPDGSGYQAVSTTQMMSVPFALYAKYGEDSDIDPANEYNTSAVLSGTDLEITDAGGTQTVDLSSLSNSGTDDQNVSGSGLSGTTLTIGIENGSNETVDLSSLVDDEDWTISGTNMYSAVTGNVGIGVTAPTYKFHVYNAVSIGATALAVSENTGIDGVAFSGENSSTSNGYNAIEGVTSYSGTGFTPSGVFGLAIDNTASTVAIGVRGATNNTDGYGVLGSRLGSSGVLGWGGVFVNDLGYTGFFGLASDARLKKNVKEIDNALSLIQNINGVTYDHKLDEYPNMGLSNGKQYGFIAQELEKIIPELVREKHLPTNGTKIVDKNNKNELKNEIFKTVNYPALIPVLVEAIKEQQIQIEELKNKETSIKLINDEIQKLKSIIDSQQYQINELKSTLENK